MQNEVVGLFSAALPRLFIDCTVGGGGHAWRLLSEIPGSRLIGIDQDEDSLALAGERLREFGPRVTLHRGDFTRFFAEAPPPRDEIGGVLIDPGLSMAQLRDGGRGFSHQLEGPLDMRKDRRQKTTASDLVNRLPEAELADLLFRYGEVRDSRRIAKRIIEHRLFAPFTTTTELAALIADIRHWHPRPGSLHPAAQVFQALRIAVNDELGQLAAFLSDLPERIAPGGRIVFIAYHSLEDRIAKQTFRDLLGADRVRLIKPFPMHPSAAEVAENNPSRSAKLRAVEAA